MAEHEKPLVYLILGATGSGRRALLADLIRSGLDETDRAAVLLPATEGLHAADQKLPQVSRWEWRDGTIGATLPGEATHVFFIVDGAKNPIDQIEAFKAWLEAQGSEIARVLCVVDAQLAEKHPSLLAWFEACVHFSDIVLLNKREGVDNKWMSAFLTHFKKQYYPCLFEPVKDDSVKNPALVLEPQARRMSHLFDAEQDWIFTTSAGEVIDEQAETEDSDEEIEAKPEEDPYLQRRIGGRRVKELPDIAKFIDPAPATDA